MITPYQKPESKDDKASNFWTNLAGKLGLSAPLIRQASVVEQKGQRLSDGIQVYGEHALSPQVRMPRETRIASVSEQNNSSADLLKRYSGVFQRAVGELGQAERVKAADRLSRIEADMAAFKDKMAGMGGDNSMTDLCGEVSAKADAVSGACVQLRDKVEGLSMPQAAAIENAFLVLSDAKTYLDKLKSPAADMGGGAMDMEMGGPSMPDLELVDGDVQEMPPAPEAEPKGPSPMAGHINAFIKKAMDEAYDDMRCIHTKLLLVESMLSALVSELNVSDMLGPSPMMTPGAPPEGMPPMEEMSGEQKPLEGDADLKELGASCKGRMSVFADSGDPGDSEPGNTIYKDLGKCRDCVWFESDWTHETYRDKCKHCTHASLGGAVDHFWPRSQQMIVWSPNWAAPQATGKKAFVGTLGLGQTAKKVSAAAVEIAAEIVASVAHTAVDLGTEFMSYFIDPVIARAMPVIAGDVADEIKSLTGIEIAITAAKAREWGHGKVAAKPIRIPKNYQVQPLKPGEPAEDMATCGSCGLSWDDGKITGITPTPSGRCPFESFHGPEPEERPERSMRLEEPDTNQLGIGGTASRAGEVIVACDTSIVALAKGEKRKIKELREQLQGEKDPAKIKSLNDAIDSLYSRMDSDKKRKEERRQQREERQKKEQEKADSEHAQIPAATASFKGTLCLAEPGGHHEDIMNRDDEAGEQGPRASGKMKDFKVVTVSKNTNSFGLHGVIMMAQDGEAWEAAHGQLELPAKGDMIRVDTGAWGASGFEIPKRLPAPPKEVISEVWGAREAASSGRSL